MAVSKAAPSFSFSPTPSVTLLWWGPAPALTVALACPADEQSRGVQQRRT
ncbi:hypothetical protein [Thermogemmatispora onikobensis]|nr:hypothetical protein [Thermogemmatispora onikobensis]